MLALLVVVILLAAVVLLVVPDSLTPIPSVIITVVLLVAFRGFVHGRIWPRYRGNFPPELQWR
jgi:hypothetical protein